MKKYILLSTGLLIASVCGAQINISEATYTSTPIGTDSLKITTAASAFPSFAAATNATWDLSTITDSAVNLFDYMVAASSPATFADSAFYSLGSYAYQGNVQSAITPAGLVEYGINIDSTHYVISSGDTIFIPTQNEAFSSTYTVIKFPATMSSSWSSVYQSNFNYQVTYSPLYVHAPGIVKSYFTEMDSVIGWGQMRIKTMAGTPSGYMAVLQVRTMVTRIDSFYLNGSTTATGMSTLLGLIGATQGQVTNTYAQNYYRLNDVVPLAYVQFTSSSYGTASKATTHVQNLPPPAGSGVQKVFNEAGINIYPNPVVGQIVTVTLPATGGAWSYELMDITGRKIQDGLLQPNGNGAQVTVPPSLIAGIYYLKINNDGRQVSVKPLEIVK